jgi:hypothetical protein
MALKWAYYFPSSSKGSTCSAHLHLQLVSCCCQTFNLLLTVFAGGINLCKLLLQLEDVCCQLLLVISKAGCLLLQLQALCFRPAQQGAGGTSGHSC